MAAIAKLKRKLFSSNKATTITTEAAEIERRMKEEKAKQKQTIRILLVGPGDSGKTTILKQMKKIHNKYDANDAKIMTQYIQDAVVGYMKMLCYQSPILHDQYDEKTLVNHELEEIRKEFVAFESPYDLNANIANQITSLWNDPGIKETLRKRHYFQIHDNVEYFFERIHTISNPMYEPSFDDYLRHTQRTRGFSQRTIIADIDKFGEHRFEVTDVGGQRSERRKWMPFISEDIHAVLYIVGIADYDLKLFEDNHTNRLIEAIELFKTIMIKGKFFANKSVLLFFNKYDLFKVKIKEVPITVAFDDFPTDEMNPNHEDDVVRFVAGKFLQVFEDQNVNLAGPLHILRTTALDTDNINKVFRDITLDLVKQNLRNYGIM
eukprot:1044379_1